MLVKHELCDRFCGQLHDTFLAIVIYLSIPVQIKASEDHPALMELHAFGDSFVYVTVEVVLAELIVIVVVSSDLHVLVPQKHHLFHLVQNVALLRYHLLYPLEVLDFLLPQLRARLI